MSLPPGPALEAREFFAVRRANADFKPEPPGAATAFINIRTAIEMDRALIELAAH